MNVATRSPRKGIIDAAIRIQARQAFVISISKLCEHSAHQNFLIWLNDRRPDFVIGVARWRKLDVQGADACGTPAFASKPKTRENKNAAVLSPIVAPLK